MTGTRPRRLLFIAVNYAPELSGTAPYTASAAEFLASKGENVQVLTGFPHYPDWSVPPEARRRLSRRESLNGVDVHRLRHFVPTSQSAARRAIYELSFASHVLVHRKLNDPDIVLAVIPNLMSAASALRIARSARAKLVVWVQDSMSGAASQSGISGGRAVAPAVAGLERYVLSKADTVIVISEGFRHLIAAHGVDPQKIVQVRNWSHQKPPGAERQSIRTKLGWHDNEIIALHAGNMGLKQGLENIVEAGRLAASRGAAVRFVLMGEGSQRSQLQRLADGVANVGFLPPVPSGTYSDLLAAADVLLINEADKVVDMSLPSKLTSYLIASRPVVAAVNPVGGTAREVHQSGAGSVIASGRPDLLLDEVLAIGTDPVAAATLGARGRDYAERVLSSKASMDSLVAALDALTPGCLTQPPTPLTGAHG